MGGEVRLATLADVEALAALDTIFEAGDAQAETVLRARVAAGECLVHASDGVIDGVAVVRPGHFFERDFVDLLLVHRPARRRGIGRALMAAARSGAGSDVVFTSTNRSNLAMQGLLAAEGWQFSGELVGLDEGDPELVYYAEAGADG